MELIEWKKEYSIGNDDIDEQHKEWINILNRLSKALAGEDHFEDDLFRAVLYYTNYHFTSEEKLMEESAYPHLESHRKMHEYFKESILEEIMSLRGGGRNDAILVMGRLKDWLVNHILKEDMKLKGLKS